MVQVVLEQNPSSSLKLTSEVQVILLVVGQNSEAFIRP